MLVREYHLKDNMKKRDILKKSSTILLTYLIMIVGYVFYCFNFNKEELSFISLFYFIILAGGGGFIPFILYLLLYDLLYRKFIKRGFFIYYYMGGILFAILILSLFISFDIFSIGKESFLKKEIILGDYNLFIVFVPIALIIDWILCVKTT